MSRANEEFHKLDGLDIEIALKVGLLVECKGHPNEYYDSCSSENIDMEVKKLLKQYNLTSEEYDTLFHSIKNIQNMYQESCVLCPKH